MLSIVIPNYFPALVWRKLHYEHGLEKHNQSVIMVTNNDGCCMTKVYLNDNQTRSILIHSIDNSQTVFVDIYLHGFNVF